ncbi:hypothetical protein FXO38_05203 [Capsicum annuum]|nr:hypothetical protein FXO38_05203 [Capsicum annuum]
MVIVTTTSLALSACTTLVFVEPKLTAEIRNLVMKGSILGVEVELPSKSYSTKLVAEENEKEPKTIAKIEDGLFLKPHIFTLTIPEIDGGTYISVTLRWSQKLLDLKPSNILLGNDMRAKVADFGLVKNALDGKYSVETWLAGTFDYLAPEYAATGQVTTKVDVYAFGVVLMEILTGRKALDETLPDERSHLISWLRRVLVNKDNLQKAIDPTLDPN